MKRWVKRWVTVLAAVIVFSGLFSACARKEPSGEKSGAKEPVTKQERQESVNPSGVIETKDITYDESARAMGFADFKDVKVDVKESLLGAQKTIAFRGKSYDILYSRTVTYVLGDITVEQYSVVGTDNGYVLLLPDDSVYAILNVPVAVLEISGFEEADSVKSQAEKELSDVIDFSAFPFVRTEESLPDKSDGFGLYSFVWYYRKGNVPSRRAVSLTVNQEGEIMELWLRNTGGREENLPDDLNHQRYVPEIEQKLTDIYGSGNYEYEIQSVELTSFEGCPSIVYLLRVNYDVEGEKTAGTRRILVKLSGTDSGKVKAESESFCGREDPEGTVPDAPDRCEIQTEKVGRSTITEPILLTDGVSSIAPCFVMYSGEIWNDSFRSLMCELAVPVDYAKLFPQLQEFDPNDNWYIKANGENTIHSMTVSRISGQSPGAEYCFSVSPVPETTSLRELAEQCGEPGKYLAEVKVLIRGEFIPEADRCESFVYSCFFEIVVP